MASEPAGISRFRVEHERLGGTGEITILPESVHTAVLAAQALGCEVGAIANSLLFRASRDGDDQLPVLILTSGAHRVDTTAVAERIRVDALFRGKPEFVKEHTGQVIGGVSPIAHPAPIETWLDPWLEQHPTVWAAAGHPSAVYSTTFAELAAMTGARTVDVEAAPA